MTHAAKIGAAILVAIVLAGQATPAARAESVSAEAHAAMSDAGFVTWLKGLMARVQADPSYKRLPLDTDAQTEAFEAKLYEAYRGVITPGEFAAWAGKTYPGHAYEIGVITGALPK